MRNSYPARQLSPMRSHTEPPPAWLPKETRRPSTSCSPGHGFGATCTSQARQQLPSPTAFPVASTHRTATCVNPEGCEASQCLPFAQGTVSEQRARTSQISSLRAHTEPPPAWLPKVTRRPSTSRSPKARFRSNVHESSAATATQPDSFPRCEYTTNCHLRESHRRRGVPVPPVRPGTVPEQRPRVQCGNSYLARQLSTLQAHTKLPHACLPQEARGPSTFRSPRHGFGATCTSQVRQQLPSPTPFLLLATTEQPPAWFRQEARRPSAPS
jgi:hypothetical protein